MITATELLGDLRRIEEGWFRCSLGIWLRELSGEDWERESIALHERLASEHETALAEKWT